VIRLFGRCFRFVVLPNLVDEHLTETSYLVTVGSDFFEPFQLVKTGYGGCFESVEPIVFRFVLCKKGDTVPVAVSIAVSSALKKGRPNEGGICSFMLSGVVASSGGVGFVKIKAGSFAIMREGGGDTFRTTLSSLLPTVVSFESFFVVKTEGEAMGAFVFATGGGG